MRLEKPSFEDREAEFFNRQVKSERMPIEEVKKEVKVVSGLDDQIEY